MKLTTLYPIFLALFSLGKAFRPPAPSGNLWGARITTNLSTSRFVSKNEWVTVVKRKNLSPGDVIPVEVDGLALLVAADLAGEFSIVSSFLLFLMRTWTHYLGMDLLVSTDAGKIYAVDDKCPPIGTPLDYGLILEGAIIVDPLNKTKFNLATGEHVGPWCPSPPFFGPLILGKLSPPERLGTFPIRAKGGDIQVFLDRQTKEKYEAKYWSGLLDAQGKATGDYY